jgi:SAM-dependent methyltransferase
MHPSSYLKARTFLETYALDLKHPGARTRVLEVGSKVHHQQDTYRDLFDDAVFAYTGLDIEAGPNVDVVPANPFVWNELASSTFDLCISGQTFEHNPYFWITFAEIARVLVPGGLAFVVAPGAGHVHRYPLDCWRFYPDSWSALCALTGMELVESYFETDRLASRIVGGGWRDSAVIARKPRLSGTALDAFHARLERIVSALREEELPVAPAVRSGPWVAAYRREAEKMAPPSWRNWLRRKRMPGIFEPRS